MAPKKPVAASKKKSTKAAPTAGVKKVSARMQAAKKSATASGAQKPARKISAKSAPAPAPAAKSAKNIKTGSKDDQKPPLAQSKKRERESELEPESAQHAAKEQRIEKEINKVPQHKLDIYVFGSGESGELGLGHVKRNGKKPTDVKRPRLNDLLDAKTVGVVAVAVGGMHCVAITYDQKILTWGVNDNGALGRDTAWEAPTRDMDAASDNSDDSDDDDDSGLNPKECTPIAIPSEYFDKAAGNIVQVAATDSASFALTSRGLVYGWGTFSGSDGVIGFTKNVKIQKTPTLLTSLKNITSLAAGGNHMLALDTQGRIHAWGCGQQSQLGRPVMDSYRSAALTPSLVRLPRAATSKSNKVASLACGQFHSFAVTSDGKVYAWGLNNFGQTGIFPPPAADPSKTPEGQQKEGKEDEESDPDPDPDPDPATLIVAKPTEVLSLAPTPIARISGGNHHSLALTATTASVLTWGRCDASQAGVPLSSVPPSHLIRDRRGAPRILACPTAIPDLPRMAHVAAGIDNNLAVDVGGRAWSWGFGSDYRTGLGSEEMVEVPTVLENAALVGKRLVWAGCGGLFSVLAGVSPGESETDGDGDGGEME